MIHGDSRNGQANAITQTAVVSPTSVNSDVKYPENPETGNPANQPHERGKRHGESDRSPVEELDLREIRISLPEVPRLTADQTAYLRAWGDSIVDMLASLSRERDTGDHTNADRELLRQINYSVLTEARATAGERLGIGINPLWNSMIDFSEGYLEERQQTYFPMSQELRGILVSTIAACYDPMLSPAAAKVLEHVSDTATDPYANVGVLLGWRYLLAREGILDATPAERRQPADPMFAEKVNRLVAMPLTNPGTHIRNPQALKRVTDLATTARDRDSREIPRDEALLHFSRIFIEGIKGQPFMEGNHRTAWILANAWLLQARGEYIPYSREIEKQSINTEVACTKWHWRVCCALGIAPSSLKQFARLLSTHVTKVDEDL